MSKRSGRRSPRLSPPEAANSTSSNSSSSSCVSSEAEAEAEADQEETRAMLLVGCLRCLMYVMLSEADPNPKCPKCKTTVLLHFLNNNKQNTNNKTSSS